MADFAGAAIRPNVADVANLMPDRTTLASADGGGEAGTFTAQTRPTAVQVDSIIDLVVDTVEPLVPSDDVAEEVLRSGRSIVALHTAILVETGHFGEQSEVNDTRVGVWERLIEMHTAVLTAAGEGNEPGSTRVYSVPIVSPIGSVLDCGDLLP